MYITLCISTKKEQKIKRKMSKVSRLFRGEPCINMGKEVHKSLLIRDLKIMTA